jgi:hypothetical protein
MGPATEEREADKYDAAKQTSGPWIAQSRSPAHAQ